jgi:hypothetical protein
VVLRRAPQGDFKMARKPVLGLALDRTEDGRLARPTVPDPRKIGSGLGQRLLPQLPHVGGTAKNSSWRSNEARISMNREIPVHSVRAKFKVIEPGIATDGTIFEGQLSKYILPKQLQDLEVGAVFSMDTRYLPQDNIIRFHPGIFIEHE